MKHSKDDFKVKFNPEGTDWQNKLAQSILKEFQSQINKEKFEHGKLHISITTNKNTGILSIDSADSTLNLPFQIEK